MKVVVLTHENLRKELLNGVEEVNENITWIEDLNQLKQADVIIDLLYEQSHKVILENLLPSLVIINSVEQTLAESNLEFVRINGWNGFLRSSIIEAAIAKESNKEKAEEVFSYFNKKIEWVADEIGFVSPRIISMIINEAFIALKEGVSTKEEIDTAMKLGTNYPFGPFEWAEKIGVAKIKGLLGKLSGQEKRYTSFIG